MLNALFYSRNTTVANGTVNIDLSLKQQAKDNIRRYIYERLPEEYEKCLVECNTKRSMDYYIAVADGR